MQVSDQWASGLQQEKKTQDRRWRDFLKEAVKDCLPNHSVSKLRAKTAWSF